MPPYAYVKGFSIFFNQFDFIQNESDDLPERIVYEDSSILYQYINLLRDFRSAYGGTSCCIRRHRQMDTYAYGGTTFI